MAANNFIAAVGRTKGALVELNLSTNTDLRSVNEFQQLVIREQNGALVRLEDVAEVVLGSEDYDTDVRFSGQTAVFMGIWPLPNANSLDVITAVRREMDAIPLALVGGLFLMQIFGFSINLLTLLAIVLAVGLVVDDAIVMVENVERHLRKGKTPV